MVIGIKAKGSLYIFKIYLSFDTKHPQTFCPSTCLKIFFPLSSSLSFSAFNSVPPGVRNLMYKNPYIVALVVSETLYKG